MDYIEKLETSIKAKLDNRVARLEEEIETLRKSQRAYICFKPKSAYFEDDGL